MNEVSIISGIVGAVIALLFIRLSALEQRLNRLSRLDAKVDALLKNAEIHFDPFRDVPMDVREALERGETIAAIKRFRESTGAGLKEAKAFIDEVRRRSADGVARL
jgi:ribosomal protein L7/L12